MGRGKSRRVFLDAEREIRTGPLDGKREIDTNEVMVNQNYYGINDGG